MSGIFGMIKGWFSGTSVPAEPAPAGKPEIYKDYLITSEPIAEEGQFRLAGRVVSKSSGKEHHFIRADVYASRKDADEAAILKGQRLVDEQGETMFT